MNQVATKDVPPIVQFKRDLQTGLDNGEFALPSTVNPSAFKNAAIIAYQGDQQLDRCTPQSVFKALRVLAGAGLMPDGREAAIVKYGNVATAMPMVAGLIKVARNSGKVKSLWADVVYEGEQLEVWIEDGEPKWNHIAADGKRIDAMSRGGEIRGAYAVAKLEDGTIDFQPMSRPEIEKRRKASSNQKSDKPTGIWSSWYGEMAKKTVIRNLSKRLPMSTEDIDRIMKEQDAPALRDVTPEPSSEAHVPLSQRLATATSEPDAVDGEILEPEEKEEAFFDEDAVDPMSEEYDEGFKASKEKSDGPCPYDPGTEKWNNWQGGFLYHSANAEGGDK